MRKVDFAQIESLAMDPANGWSIGGFGAIAEFMRDSGETVEIKKNSTSLEFVTLRGAMRIAPTSDLHGIAWDSLSPDGKSWSHELAFCVRRPAKSVEVVRLIGRDETAIRPIDREDILYDLGVCQGSVALAIRSSDALLNAALNSIAGDRLFDHPEVLREIMRVQPHRVGFSPVGRIEVYQPIPEESGSSPIGPHTHILPRLIAAKQTHAKTAPIPMGWQPVLSMHPPSPWRNSLGVPRPFEAEVDRRFAPLLDQFGTSEDKAVEAQVRTLLLFGSDTIEWPDSRRGRTKARITLRRMAVAGDGRSNALLSRYDASARRMRSPETTANSQLVKTSQDAPVETIIS